MGKKAYTRLSSLLTYLQVQRPPKTTYSPNDSWRRLTELTNSYYTHCCDLLQLRTSLVVQTVKNLPAMQETWVQSLGQEDPLEKGMATHSSILVWRIPWTEEPDRLQSMGSQRVGRDWRTNTFHFFITAKGYRLKSVKEKSARTDGRKAPNRPSSWPLPHRVGTALLSWHRYVTIYTEDCQSGKFTQASMFIVFIKAL